MKIFFISSKHSKLADDESNALNGIKDELLLLPLVEETDSPNLADVLLIQEKNSFKNFRYIDEILNDSFLSKYYNKTFTINDDDCATGLFKGLYTSLPKSRFNSSIYAVVPFFEYPNKLVFAKQNKVGRLNYLAGWRGNTKSNSIRAVIIKLFQNNPAFSLETTDSWLNHANEEKQHYIDFVLNAKFSLCPSGWAAVSFRIYESMALGRCPVIIADEFVPPVGPEWKNFALFLPEKEVANLHNFLLANEHLYEQFGQQAFKAWTDFFGPDKIKKYYAESLYRILCRNTNASKETEMKRWTSWKLHWSNHWTVPQRVFNKARKMISSVSTSK